MEILDEADDKFLTYLSNEENVKSFFNQSITEIGRRLKENEGLASVYKINDNKRMFEAVMRAKHVLYSELSIAQLLKLNFLSNVRHQIQIKDALTAIKKHNKKDIGYVLERIIDLEKESINLRGDSEFIDYLKRHYEDKASDVSLE